MEEKTAGNTPAEPCLCRDLTNQIASMLGTRSPEAREHFRNARIEVLKAVRSVLDERIDQLSRTQRKGTQVPVE